MNKTNTVRDCKDKIIPFIKESIANRVYVRCGCGAEFELYYSISVWRNGPRRYRVERTGKKDPRAAVFARDTTDEDYFLDFFNCMDDVREISFMTMHGSPLGLTGNCRMEEVERIAFD